MSTKTLLTAPHMRPKRLSQLSATLLKKLATRYARYLVRSVAKLNYHGVQSFCLFAVKLALQ